MQKFREVHVCRICGNKNIVPVLSLGSQTLTGVFPSKKEQEITIGPLELVKCMDNGQNDTCGLVQLAHTYIPSEMYGENYGYRSGLNKLMVDHLNGKVAKIVKMISLNKGDIVLDIGSNDSTMLQAYPNNLSLVGIDPTGYKFESYYPPHIQLIPTFFDASVFKKHFGDKKAKVVTSISMFYDLDAPLDFMQSVFDILADDGIWVFEQSYMPTMLDRNSYDTICHEHLEYYCLKQIKWMTDKIGFKIQDVEFNDINGGSFSITVSKKTSSYKENISLVNEILTAEKNRLLDSTKPLEEFNERLKACKTKLLEFIKKAKSENKVIMGYGASTKGNVLLQYCGITTDMIPYIAEVNEKKFGCFTPHTLIPIISETEAIKMKPDYLLVLPWHLKDNIIFKEKDYLMNGGTLVFPLPEIELVTSKYLAKWI